MNKQFIELLRESVLVQGLITLVIVLTISYMYVTEMSVPQELFNILLLILGFYFGGKVERQAHRKVINYENSVSNNSNRRHQNRGLRQD